MKSKRLPIIIALVVLALTSMTCSVDIPDVNFNPTEVVGDVIQTAQVLQLTLAVQQETAQGFIETLAATAIPPGLSTSVVETITAFPGLTKGSIQGNLTYPSEFIPKLRIVAFEVSGGLPTGNYYKAETDENQTTYTITDLAPGTYWVVAYVREDAGEQGLSAGYTAAVTCGLDVTCTDHSLVEVTVAAAAITSDINPTDWYAPAGSFPADPYKIQ